MGEGGVGGSRPRGPSGAHFKQRGLCDGVLTWCSCGYWNGGHDGEEPTAFVLSANIHRRDACQLAGIEPTVRHLDGEDPTAFVLSANVHRRHLTKGQRAMAVAIISPEPRQGKKATSSVTKEVSGERLSLARTVLRDASDLADNVLAGSLSLDAAYQELRMRTMCRASRLTSLARLRCWRIDVGA